MRTLKTLAIVWLAIAMLWGSSIAALGLPERTAQATVLGYSADDVIMGDATTAIADVAREFNLPPITVQTGAFPDSNVLAMTQSIYEPGQPPVFVITFNQEYTSNPQRFNELVTNDTISGFHPELGGCSPARLIALHEAAHVLDAVGHRMAREIVAELPTTPTDLSGYSYAIGTIINPPEALAEAFAAVKCEPNPSPGEWQLFNILTADYPR